MDCGSHHDFGVRCAPTCSTFRLQGLSLVAIGIFLPLLLGTLGWLLASSEIASLSLGAKLTTGAVYETHISEGKPSIEVRMRSFVDAGFDAYLIDSNGNRSKLFASLPSSGAAFGYSTNVTKHSNLATRVSVAAGSPTMFEVFWSKDGQRFALAFRGFLVAAYDRNSARKMSLDLVGPNLPIKEWDDQLARFLRGDQITDDDLAQLRRRWWGEQMKSQSTNFK